jgi:hypothetical protein
MKINQLINRQFINNEKTNQIENKRERNEKFTGWR